MKEISLIERKLALRGLKSVVKQSEVAIKLSSGRLSSYYVDVKEYALSSNGHYYLGSLILDQIRSGNYEGLNGIAGVVLGGCSLVSAVSTLSQNENENRRWQNLNVLYVRKEPKAHGTQKLIEGYYEPGFKVLLIEDVVTSGGSALKAIQVLREVELEVVGVIAVVDRNEGGRELFAQNNIPFEALFNIEEILENGSG